MSIATIVADNPDLSSLAFPPDVPVPNPLPKLLAGEDLSSAESEHLFERLVLGRLEPAEIAGMLIALRMKGETAAEMIGGGRGLAAAAGPLSRPRYFYPGRCGAGGRWPRPLKPFTRP